MLVGCFLSGTIKAQEMVGGTEDQVRRAYPDYSFYVFNLPDGSRTISMTCLLGPFVYHFDKYQLVDICMLTAYPEGLNDIIQFNNRNYTKISDTKWKKYRLGKVIVINLVYDKNSDSYVFSFMESMDK